MSEADERNAKTLADEIIRLRAAADQDRARMDIMERTILTQQSEIRKLQELFATKTVARDSGPTVIEE